MLETLNLYQEEIIKALMETGILIGVSTLAAILIGLPLGTLLFVTKKDGLKENKTLYFLSNLYVNIVRSFPFLIFVFAMIPVTRFLLGKSLGTLPATVPLSCVAIAIFARHVEVALLEVPQEVIDSAKSMGATPYQIITKFVYVEARSSIILGLTNAIISFISYSTVMGVVGGGGIGDFAMRYGYHQYNYALMYTIVIIMVVIVQFIQIIGNQWALKLDKR